MGFSNEIMIIRQKAFMTQETFAKALNVAFSTVNRWEFGKTHPNMTAMKQFCSRRFNKRLGRMEEYRRKNIGWNLSQVLKIAVFCIYNRLENNVK